MESMPTDCQIDHKALKQRRPRLGSCLIKRYGAPGSRAHHVYIQTQTITKCPLARPEGSSKTLDTSHRILGPSHPTSQTTRSNVAHVEQVGGGLEDKADPIDGHRQQNDKSAKQGDIESPFVKYFYLRSLRLKSAFAVAKRPHRDPQVPVDTDQLAYVIPAVARSGRSGRVAITHHELVARPTAGIGELARRPSRCSRQGRRTWGRCCSAAHW
jgi:hypothetical protein